MKGIQRIDDPTALDGYREVCSPHQYRKRREELCKRADSLCERCTAWAPIHMGDWHHKRKRGMGGANRDDRLTNAEWLCKLCHEEEERPAPSGAGRIITPSIEDAPARS